MIQPQLPGHRQLAAKLDRQKGTLALAQRREAQEEHEKFVLNRRSQIGSAKTQKQQTILDVVRFPCAREIVSESTTQYSYLIEL